MLLLNALPASVCCQFCVATGSRVAARMERLRGCCRDRSARASMGPVASRSWKPGKRRRAMRVGLVVDISRSGSMQWIWRKAIHFDVMMFQSNLFERLTGFLYIYKLFSIQM
jgi:hypothetical protein